MATTVRITETYDMKTTVNKMGIVGIHTPQVTLLRKLYPGLMKNHRFMRFVKCDIAGACASVLPADPLQVGVTSGTVAPEDMFNPILYTAVTNSSFDTLIARIRNLADVSALGSVSDGLVNTQMDDSQNFKTYYALLSENGKYKKSMPQSGFMIKGLVPLAHTVISTYGNVGSIGNATVLEDDGETPIPAPDMQIPEVKNDWSITQGSEIFYRGKSVKMPKFAIHTTEEGITDIPNPNVPKTYVLAMVLPPAKLHEFYYRMRVTWTIRFEGVVTSTEAGTIGAYFDVGAYSHGQNYTYSNAKENLSKSEEMVSATDVDITKVMES